MACKTKVILVVVSEIIKNSKDKKEIYEKIAKMANAEGLVLDPYDESK